MIRRNRYNTTSTIKTKKSNKQLRKLYKEYINLSNKEIKIELKKEDSSNYKNIRDNQFTKDLNILIATNQKPPNSNTDSLINQENIMPRGLIY